VGLNVLGNKKDVIKREKNIVRVKLLKRIRYVCNFKEDGFIKAIFLQFLNLEAPDSHG
jgi:hypothetical protein